MRPVDLDRLRTAEQVGVCCGIVLVVDLLFLPWQSIDLGLATFSRSAVESPNAALGVLAVLLTVVVVAVTVLRAWRPDAPLPTVPLGWDQALAVGAAATLVLLLVKLALETGSLGVGAWLAIALASGQTASAASAWSGWAALPATLRNRAASRNC